MTTGKTARTPIGQLSAAHLGLRVAVQRVPADGRLEQTGQLVVGTLRKVEHDEFAIGHPRTTVTIANGEGRHELRRPDDFLIELSSEVPG